jgi:hypothetical protein
MPASRKYATAGSFRQALEERRNTISRDERPDFQRLCRQVGLDRFLARLAPVNNFDWILKGGYAMELRFDTARSTRDLDFTLRKGNNDTALTSLQRAATINIEDFFTFRVGEAMADLDAAPYGGARHPVEARVDGRAFVRFHVDVGIGDVIVEPIETVAARDWLAFAEIAPPSIPLISRADLARAAVRRKDSRVLITAHESQQPRSRSGRPLPPHRIRHLGSSTLCRCTPPHVRTARHPRSAKRTHTSATALGAAVPRHG